MKKLYHIISAALLAVSMTTAGARAQNFWQEVAQPVTDSVTSIHQVITGQDNRIIFVNRNNVTGLKSLYTSTDNGDHWTKLATDLKGSKFALSPANELYKTVDTLGVSDPWDHSLVNSVYLYRSTDFGLSWRLITSQRGGLGVSVGMNQMFFDTMGALCCWYSGNGYVNTYNWIDYTTDAGKTWLNATRLNQEMNVLHMVTRALIYAGTFYADDTGGYRGSLARYADSAWKVLIDSFTVGGLALGREGEIYAGSRPNIFTAVPYQPYKLAIWYSADNGLRWERISGALPDSFSVFDMITPQKGLLFCSFDNAPYAIYRTADNGITWIRTTDGLKQNTARYYLQYSKNGYVFAIGGNRIYRSAKTVLGVGQQALPPPCPGCRPNLW